MGYTRSFFFLQLRICVRVLPSHRERLSDVADSPENAFLTVDSRRKQVTVLESPTSTVAHTAGPSATQQRTVSRNYAFDSVFAQDDSLVRLIITLNKHWKHGIFSD
jgi:hypothetical protein